ncbi:hypothetical protein MTP99_018916 [Tenebrio molitor]|nr:hypothetical protein MTP99_018916 [Tenebrio molitor]
MAKKKAVCDVSTSSHNSVRRTLSKAGKANEQNGDLVVILNPSGDLIKFIFTYMGNYPGGPKVSLFNFPKDKDLKARWVQAIKRQGENGKSFVPTASSKVCELHFHEQDILRFTTMHDEKTGTILKAPLKYPRPAPGAVPVHVLNSPSSSAVQNDPPRREAPSTKRARLDSENLSNAIAASLETHINYEQAKSFQCFNELKMKLKNHAVKLEDKSVILLMDEVHLKPDLDYKGAKLLELLLMVQKMLQAHLSL